MIEHIEVCEKTHYFHKIEKFTIIHYDKLKGEYAVNFFKNGKDCTLWEIPQGIIKYFNEYYLQEIKEELDKENDNCNLISMGTTYTY